MRILIAISLLILVGAGCVANQDNEKLHPDCKLTVEEAKLRSKEYAISNNKNWGAIESVSYYEPRQEYHIVYPTPEGQRLLLGENGTMVNCITGETRIMPLE